MTGTEGRGPGDLGEAAMPETEQRDPPTQHGQTASPAEGESPEKGPEKGEEGDEGGIGDKVKSAVGGVIGKAKGMIGGDKG